MKTFLCVLLLAALATPSAYALFGKDEKDKLPPSRFDEKRAVYSEIPGIPASADASCGMLVDLGPEEALWLRKPKAPFKIGAMTKLMTALLAYDIASEGSKFTLDAKLRTSEKAVKEGGRDSALLPGEMATPRELLTLLLVRGANDPAYVFAENIGRKGYVEAFVARMNRKAMSIGMTASFFTSPDGREPKIGKAEFEEKPDCASTPEDMVVLAKEIIKRKELLAICSAWKGEFLGQRAGGPLEFKNSNRLLPGGPEACPGVDGLRTAYVKGDGYCSLTTCLRDGRRMVAVVAGFPTREGRDAFVAKLLDWGYSIKPKLGPTRPDEVPAGSK